MEHDGILSFQTPLTEADHVEALPSPALELAYANYFLRRSAVDGRGAEVPWLGTLLSEHAELVEGLRRFGPPAESEGPVDESAHDLFVMVCELGYARDARPDRFLEDLPQLPVRLLERLADRGEELLGSDEDGNGGEGSVERMRERLSWLASGDRAQRLASLLSSFWRALAPAWGREGAEAVRRACDSFLEGYRRSGDVLAALPPHHFTQFEVSARQIRTAQRSGRILVTPLFFAAGGGFNVEIRGVRYIGFGLLSESVFERTASRVGEVAARMKAFADPTRLMLLALVSRFSALTLTVGDLAVQLGVSQPTASGHLKVLREAGIVQLERKGNRSYYRVDESAVREVLEELQGMIAEPD